MNCRICESISTTFGSARIMGKYFVSYYLCSDCGFIQTEAPYWLHESYSKAINDGDVGLVSRNFTLSCIAQSIIWKFYNPRGHFLDYAGGYGLLVRLMRDAGYDFYWYDRYCDNYFAQGFAISGEKHGLFDLVTAFEVVEHLSNPLEEMREIMAYSRNILFTTEIMPAPPPELDNWWYYGLDHGQHISFFTISALNALARKLSLFLYTDGKSVHLLTEKKISPAVFRLFANYRVANLFRGLFRRKSLLMSDFETARGNQGKTGV